MTLFFNFLQQVLYKLSLYIINKLESISEEIICIEYYTHKIIYLLIEVLNPPRNASIDTYNTHLLQSNTSHLRYCKKPKKNYTIS